METDANSTGNEFSPPPAAPSRPLAWLRRGIIGLGVLLLLSGLGSGYRAIAPPRLELTLGSPDENVVAVRVHSSGRGVVDLNVEWLDGDRAVVLAKLFVPGRDYPVFDFRPVEREFHVPLPGNRAPGSRVRVTAFPSPQWTWRPPAVMREIDLPGLVDAR